MAIEKSCQADSRSFSWTRSLFLVGAFRGCGGSGGCGGGGLYHVFALPASGAGFAAAEATALMYTRYSGVGTRIGGTLVPRMVKTCPCFRRRGGCFTAATGYGGSWRGGAYGLCGGHAGLLRRVACGRGCGCGCGRGCGRDLGLGDFRRGRCPVCLLWCWRWLDGARSAGLLGTREWTKSGALLREGWLRWRLSFEFPSCL